MTIHISDNTVNFILKKINEGNKGSNYADFLTPTIELEEVNAALSKLETLGYIEALNEGYYKLTKFGYEIRRAGGWIKYHEQMTQDKQRERDNIDASIRTAKLIEKNQERQNKNTNITLIVAAVAAIGTLGQWLSPLKQQENTLPKNQIQFFDRSQSTENKGCHNSPNKGIYHRKTDSSSTKDSL